MNVLKISDHIKIKMTKQEGLRITIDEPPATTQSTGATGLGGRRNSSLMMSRTSGGGGSLMTPRGNLRMASLIRTSYLEENKKRKGFAVRLEYADNEVEDIYRQESWLKTRVGYMVYVSLVVAGGLYDFWKDAHLLRNPLIVCIVSGLMFPIACFSTSIPIILQAYAIVAPIFLAIQMAAGNLVHCRYGVVDDYACKRLDEDSEIPAAWLVFPFLSLIMGYFAPVTFSQSFPSRVFLIVVVAINIAIHCKSMDCLGVLFGFLATCLAIIKRLHTLESRDRAFFLEAHLAMKSLSSQTMMKDDPETQVAEMTLVRNAMRLTFPENPFHDAATEARVERCRSELGVPNQDSYVSEGLLPAQNGPPLPEQLKVLSSKLRGIKVARYKLHGDPVVVHSITNLEVLESDDDLKEFITTVRNASDLAEIPGLTKTVGYCLSPCTFVVEDLLDIPLVSLHDLALELGAHELKLDWCYFKPLAACLTSTLAVLHRNGVLHRNISSHSIHLTSKETCVLAAVNFYHAFPEARRKIWGSMSGVWTVPPEAKSSPEKYTAASEVYAFCAVAWEMLVGPFAQEISALSVPATVPKAIMNLMIDGLSNDPEGRPTMDELFDAFNEEDPSRASTVASKEVFESVIKRLERAPLEKSIKKKKSKRTRPATGEGRSPGSSKRSLNANLPPRPSSTGTSPKVRFASLNPATDH